MSRIYREQPQSVRDKISQTLKTYHANKSERDKEATRNAQAKSMREYWAQIPHRPNNDNDEHATMDDLL